MQAEHKKIKAKTTETNLTAEIFSDVVQMEGFIFFAKFNIFLETCYKSNGCKECNGLGYKGRIGIFSLLSFSEKFKSLVTQNPQFDKLYDAAIEDGMKPLIYDAIKI